MKDVDTYLLMVELHTRIADYLYDPEPEHDAMLSELWNDVKRNEQVMKRMEREMRTLMARYRNILQERLQNEEA